MSLTNIGERSSLDYITGVSPVANRYLALFTAPPGETGGGTEVSGGGYTRKDVNYGAATTSGSNVTSSENSAEVLFPSATASWGIITHIAVFDALTAGNMLWYGVLSENMKVTENIQIRFKAGTLTITCD